MTTQTKEKAATLLAAFPVACFLLLYLFVVRARLHFGHWPSTSDGMAKYIGFTFNHSLVIYALLASPLVVLTVVVAVILFRRQDARFRLGPPIVVLGGSVLLCLALIALDPARFISWFVD